MTRPGSATILDRLLEHDNDWTQEALAWSHHSPDALTGEISRAPGSEVRVSVPVTVVVSACNVAPSITHVLRALELSSLNARRPDLLEVVVVDDGSTDDTWELLSRFAGNLTLRAIHQENSGQARAMNTGIAVSTGEIIIALDGDMVLSYWTVEEMARRHQVLANVVIVGFRTNLYPDDKQLADVAAGEIGPLTVHRYAGDNRFVFDTPGWPDNMFTDTSAYKLLGGHRRLWMPSGQTWDLPRMVYGCLFSLRRSTLDLVGGFDEANYGWGWMDTTIGAQAIAHDHKIVPVLTANGIHIKHPPRSPHRWQESSRNRVRYHEVLRSPVDSRAEPFRLARRRVRREIMRTASRPAAEPAAVEPVWPADPVERARQLALAGHDDAAARLVTSLACERPDAAIVLAGIRRRSGHAVEALEILDAAPRPAGSLAVDRERAFTLAACGEFDQAHACFAGLYDRDPLERLVRYAFKMPAYRHRRHAGKHLRAGFVPVARRDLEAALAQDPGDSATRATWEALR